jgi:hypothetical protein
MATVFDRLLAGERVTLEAHGHRFDMTYGPESSPCFTTYHGQNATSSPPIAADVARAHFEEQERRYGWRDVDAPVAAALEDIVVDAPAVETIAAHAEEEVPVATLIADAVAAVDAPRPPRAVVDPVKLETPLPRVKVEAAKVKIAPIPKRESTFSVEETPTERPSNKKTTSKKKGK